MTGSPEDALPGALGVELSGRMADLTWDRIGELSLANARANLAYLDRGQSISALRGRGAGGSGVVIGAGPSLRRQDPASLIAGAGYGGTIIATDSALAYCLKGGMVPDLIVSLDPHGERIVRWFGDPELSEARIQGDDYFRRQDLDATFADELATNRALLDLIDRHGPQMSIALATSASHRVVERVLAAGMTIYWWNPMLDDPDRPGSATRELQGLNGLPAINAGGNVGSASWMIADAVLGLDCVALTGLDFSYYDGTPYQNTQYYWETVALVGEDVLDRVFVRIHNPHIDKWFFTDPAYLWYKRCFLDMVGEADCRTFNCTEGGILFGEGIEFVPLREFLAQRSELE